MRTYAVNYYNYNYESNLKWNRPKRHWMHVWEHFLISTSRGRKAEMKCGSEGKSDSGEVSQRRLTSAELRDSVLCELQTSLFIFLGGGEYLNVF